MSADIDAFSDATADLGFAVERYHEELMFDGDKPSWPKQERIIAAWNDLLAKKAKWTALLLKLEQAAR